DGRAGAPLRAPRRAATGPDRHVRGTQAATQNASAGKPAHLATTAPSRPPIRWIVKCEGSLQRRPTAGKFPEMETRQPAGIPPHDLHWDVAGGFPQLSQLRSEPPRLLQIGPSPMLDKLAPEGGQQRARPVQRQREVPCPRVHLTQLRRSPTLARDQR